MAVEKDRVLEDLKLLDTPTLVGMAKACMESGLKDQEFMAKIRQVLAERKPDEEIQTNRSFHEADDDPLFGPNAV